jgi:chemotaxis protein methyltransferase CheR
VELVQLNQRQFDKFRAYVYKVSGIRLNDKKLLLLSNRIRRRLKAGRFTDFDAYYRYLIGPSGHGELEHFLDAITTNETSFFRTERHFEWFTDEFLKDLIREVREGQRTRSIRIWSAGCATGAEPYTIAICLWENRHRLSDWSLSIVGTDISEEALRAARAGIFEARSVEAVSERQLRHCFEPSGDESGCWQVRPQLKELVRFKRHNLITPMRQAPFDCVFIRNVLIYFDRDSKRTVVDNLINALEPGGFLVIGPSEGIFDMLEPLERRNSLLYRKPAKGLP